MAKKSKPKPDTEPKSHAKKSAPADAHDASGARRKLIRWPERRNNGFNAAVPRPSTKVKIESRAKRFAELGIGGADDFFVAAFP